MEKYGLKAFVVLPIYLGDEVIMYLQFGCKNRECQWEIETIRFLSNVRKIVQSIITKRVTQNSLTSSISALEGIMENLGCGVVVVRPQNRQVLFANHLLSRELHETFEKLDLRKLFPEGMNSTEYYIGALQKWMLLYRATISWVDGNEVELYSFYDITKNKTVENDYKKSTTSDFLTGLYNRKRCEEDLASYLEMTKQGNGKGALLFIDLDDFKRINDGLGHQYGDILLKAISSNLRRVPGIENSCYRVGGDEFMVIVSGIQYERLDEIVESISEIFKYPWFLKGHDYYCNMSMGVTRFPRDASTVEDVIRCVDAALYDAKKKGKNQVKFFDRNDNDTDNFMRLDMEKFIRDACTNIQEEFEVYYQPIIDISLPGDPCVGAEALLRWNSKEMGEISPTDFVPLAEYLGLIKPIGEHVLRTACKECKRWNDMGHPNYKVNVNFSVVQLLQQDIQNVITDVLAETGLEPHNLTIEVTESLAINDLAYMKQVLNSIRRIGVRVALDDFGTGYSSLNHIHEMPIDIIKVDRCFVQNIGEEEYSQVFVRMVSELAKTMKMNVCVEGVETDVQYKIMKKHNINMIQGYYFAEPMPAKEFELKFTE
ncbi:MAG: bifunctional diguanylate cyclase/phosphodiesterase [Lachnospiraceae bacterium]|nr:bifunctional diguanylate cyclase/phosphodiesterase [Lachnospiraceae bacterium]